MSENKKAEHTNGPWEFDGDSYITTDNGQKMIAQVRGWGWLQYLGEEKAIAIQEANGHLLAAAPDLLEALRNACDTIVLLNGLREDWSSLRVQDYREVIAKAEGRS